MASSAVSHALDNLLEALDGELEGRELNDYEISLLDNAEAVLEEYKGATNEDAGRLADQVRVQLALLVQHINQEFPEMVGSRELQDATEVLATPHLPASNVAQGGEPALGRNRPGPVSADPLAPGEGDVEPAENDPLLTPGAVPEHRTDGGMVEQDLNLSERRGEHDPTSFNAYDGDDGLRSGTSLVNEFNAEKNASQAQTGEHGTEFRPRDTDTKGKKGPNVLETRDEPKGFDALDAKAEEKKAGRPAKKDNK